MLVHVFAVDEKFKSSLQIYPEEPIKALFLKLSVKIKNISPKTYQFRVYQTDPELRVYINHFVSSYDPILMYR